MNWLRRRIVKYFLPLQYWWYWAIVAAFITVMMTLDGWDGKIDDKIPFHDAVIYVVMATTLLTFIICGHFAGMWKRLMEP